MKHQWHVFLTAVMFLTRIPVPHNIDHSSGMLQKAARYFTWVGLVVGVIGGGVFFLLNKYLPGSLSIAFSMLATILATGAFHEDGFADCCDAFGGGWTKEKILLIMKDSRLGTYGVVGLLGVLGFKFLLLSSLIVLCDPLHLALLIIAAHSTSRLMAIGIMQSYSYVQDTDTSKSKPIASRKLTTLELLIAVSGALLPMLLLKPALWLVLLPMGIACWWAGRYFHKWIGGYTGDCLGATQQLTELVFYLSVFFIIR
ncbi:MAG: adenosylcobinamide-GDP ribazoletransferase [Sediminibacterium magnilacihabitans]|nr:adenosylcobinamide-GDP ribazoletransferase [Sediminibacterium magnilacihabitans]